MLRDLENIIRDFAQPLTLGQRCKVYNEVSLDMIRNSWWGRDLIESPKFLEPVTVSRIAFVVLKFISSEVVQQLQLNVLKKMDETLEHDTFYGFFLYGLRQIRMGLETCPIKKQEIKDRYFFCWTRFGRQLELLEEYAEIQDNLIPPENV